jgi:AraC-like DNA-binding protein
LSKSIININLKMPDKGIFITQNGNNQSLVFDAQLMYKMSKESMTSELRVNGTLLQRVQISSGGFYLYNLKIIPQEFYILFSNSATIKVDGENHRMLLLPNQYLILNEDKENNYRFFINYLEHHDDIYFVRLNCEKFHSFKAAIALNKEMPMDVEMISILGNMFSCDYPADLKSTYLEAKTIELLCHIENQIKAIRENVDTLDVPAHMLAPIQLARDIMIDNLKEPLSLASLARKVGTNENYLKKYFKLVFGQTVFGFLNEHKMQLAKKMLTKKKMPVSQVAADLGYKNSSNFSANFFKYYGFLPKKLKSAKLYLLLFTEDFLMLLEEVAITLGN